MKGRAVMRSRAGSRSGSLATVADASAEGDAKRGKVLAYTCHGCHGVPDYKNAFPNYSVPKLGGQNAAVPDQRPERLRQRRPPAPDHALAGRDAVRPGSRRHRRVPAERSRAAQQAGRRHAAAGHADLRGLPRLRRREDHRARLPDPRRAVPRLHRARAAGIQERQAQEPDHGRHHRRRRREGLRGDRRSSSAGSTACAAPIELREHGKCVRDSE